MVVVLLGTYWGAGVGREGAKTCLGVQLYQHLYITPRERNAELDIFK